MTIKIKVGTLILTQSHDEAIPQEFAAWHQTVRVSPGTYDVFAYLDSDRIVRQLSAQCEGITVSSNFRAHMFGTWGKSDNNKNGEPATVHIHLPTFGQVETQTPSLLAQTTLCDALVRDEWDPREIDPRSMSGKMWRFTWNPARKPIIIEESRHGGGLRLAAFEDPRRFRVDNTEMAPDALRSLDLSLSGFVRSVDQLTVNETATGWSFSLQRECLVTRLA
jgi:hypothetical protein